MEALICRKLGDPTVSPNGEDSALTISTTHPIPQLDSPTSVRIRVKATSLNFLNYLQIFGQYQEKPPLPFVPGSDYSGIVDAVGLNVTKFKIGDPVCAHSKVGSFAQFIVAEESQLFMVPQRCDLVDAATVPIAYGTSHISLVHKARLHAGQVLLVLGAAGGVGTSAVQIGKIRGAIVIAVARGDDKVQFLKSLGVDHVVNLSKENVVESVKGFLKQEKLKGVDVLYDPVGANNILVIGFASGEVPVIPANIALVKNWTIHGFYMEAYAKIAPYIVQDSVNELLSWLATGLITIPISHTFTLSEANLAFAALRDRKAIGKIMIVLDNQNTLSAKL